MSGRNLYSMPEVLNDPQEWHAYLDKMWSFIESAISQSIEKREEEILEEAEKLFDTWFSQKKVVDGYFQMDSHSVNRLGGKFLDTILNKECKACLGTGEYRQWVDGEMDVTTCVRCKGTGKQDKPIKGGDK